VGKLLGSAVSESADGEVVAAIIDDKYALLNSGGFGDGPVGAGEEAAAHDTALAVALSDALVVTAFFREFISDLSDSVGKLSELRPALDLLLRMSKEPGAETPRKRTLLLVIRDYEADEGVSEDELRARFIALLDAVWATLPAARTSAAKPGAAAASALRLSDLLEVQVAVLPLPKLDSAAFGAATDALKAKLRAAASPAAAAPASRVLGSLTALAKAAAQAQPPSTEGVSAEELAAALACARAANEALDELKLASAELRAAIGTETFASACSDAHAGALRSYDAATKRFAEAPIVAKRRAHLVGSVLAELRPLYTEAVRRKMIAALTEFPRRAASSAATNLAAALQTHVDQAVEAFKEAASGQCMPEAAASWNAALEEKMLLKARTSDRPLRRRANERRASVCAHLCARADTLCPRLLRASRFRRAQELQVQTAEMIRKAQLQGLYTLPTERVPTGIALHWLHPNPFGKDLRTDQLSASDRLAYSQRAKELLRSSPMRIGTGGDGKKLSTSAFSGGIKLTEADLILKEEVRRKASAGASVPRASLLTRRRPRVCAVACALLVCAAPPSLSKVVGVRGIAAGRLCCYTVDDFRPRRPLWMPTWSMIGGLCGCLLNHGAALWFSSGWRKGIVEQLSAHAAHDWRRRVSQSVQQLIREVILRGTTSVVWRPRSLCGRVSYSHVHRL
jgi:hypothetical protein